MTNAKLRVLYLQPAPLFGGAERQVAEQASFLSLRGIELVVIGGPGPTLGRWMREAGHGEFIHSRNFPAWSAQRGLRALTLPWRYLRCGLRARAEFAAAMAKRRFDIVVASLPFAWIVGTLVARANGVPIVWRAGGSRISKFQALCLWLLTRFMRPDLLLCNGNAVRDLFHPLVGTPVEIVSNGVDPALFGPSSGDARLYRPSGAEVVVGFAGRLERSKHVEDVIALARHLQETRLGARVLIAGQGSERAALQQAGEAMQLHNLVFLGFVSDMASFYAACDLVILPSESEGCPNVLLEAMRSGKAVVASDIAPSLELIDDGKTGLIYPLEDVRALVAAVDRLLEDPEYREQLAQQGRLRVEELTAAAAAERLAQILREVARQGRESTRALLGTRAATVAPRRERADALRVHPSHMAADSAKD